MTGPADSPSEPQPVAEVDAAALVRWCYGGAEIRINGPEHQPMPLPDRAAFVALLDLVAGQDGRWVLADGPRPARPYWLLDPWWHDRPEMPAGLAQTIQAGCVSVADLRAALAAA